MRLRAELKRLGHAESLGRLRRFAAADPTDWESRRALAVEEQVAGRPDEADRQIAACLRARPDDPWVWRSRLAILHLRGDRDALSAALRRLPRSADSDPEVWKYRGLSLLADGAADAAAVAFRRAVALNPSEPEYAYHLGMAEQRQGLRDQSALNLLCSRRLREDLRQLDDAYHAYAAVAARDRPDDPDRAPAAERIASLCERLGWVRDAAAWRNTVAGG
jgi:Flp pilus assembly protein TadD